MSETDLTNGQGGVDLSNLRLDEKLGWLVDLPDEPDCDDCFLPLDDVWDSFSLDQLLRAGMAYEQRTGYTAALRKALGTNELPSPEEFASLWLSLTPPAREAHRRLMAAKE
jgi:hypothetical protein